MPKLESYTYDTKCRVCGDVKSIFFAHLIHTKPETFFAYMTEKARAPIPDECSCQKDNSKLTLHDLVSFTNPDIS